MNLATLLRRAALDRPDGVALRLDDTEIDYRSFAEQGARFAAYLRATGRARRLLPAQPAGVSRRPAWHLAGGSRRRPAQPPLPGRAAAPCGDRRRAQQAGRAAAGSRPPPCTTGTCGTGDAHHRARRRVRPGARGARADGGRRPPARPRRRLPDVHLRVHRCAQGRAADPPQPRRRGGRGDRVLRSHRGRPRAELHAAVPRRRPTAGERPRAAAWWADHLHAPLGRNPLARARPGAAPDLRRPDLDDDDRRRQPDRRRTRRAGLFPHLHVLAPAPRPRRSRGWRRAPGSRGPRSTARPSRTASWCPTGRGRSGARTPWAGRWSRSSAPGWCRSTVARTWRRGTAGSASSGCRATRSRRGTGTSRSPISGPTGAGTARAT